jgi:CheY-like chemotaxis protein
LSARRVSSLAGHSILVVDDEPGNVALLLGVLRDAGHRALGASDGREALSKLDASAPELVLLDLEMPVMDGGQTLRALRSSTRFARMPVVVMSGLALEVVQRRCRGYDAVLHKPFTLGDLLATIERLLAPGAARVRAKRRAPR